ncbi:hypothetical protein [Streptomyces sp. NBC_01429]|uniref:hypothetical protein n=1 Tax=Streptomyces sp. NBC_01429 TaxID=2903862 RepID=UPI002E2BE69C|nr:hypothetical protein [Streptomyces sp. NBC_01429]
MIEFKKGSDSGVLSQAVSYLSWLESAHHEFEALVRKVLGAEAAESIDWRRPRMVRIAAGFSQGSTLRLIQARRNPRSAGI